jgi:adenylosuccinate synthase
MFVDIVLGLQYGDEAKAKVVNSLLKTGEYNVVARVSGGCNAGHTLYHNGQKIVLHQVPAGVIHNITSFISSGCVIDVVKLKEEIDYIQSKTGIDATKYLRIAYNAHIILPEHVKEDEETDKIGSTKRGIMPAYRAKHGRTGLRANQVNEEWFQNLVCDPTKDLWFLLEECHEDFDVKVLVEGAQGTFLDVDHGDYPYVTSSSNTSAYSLHSLGLPPQCIRKVYGVAKCYETYVGTKPFQPKGKLFEDLRRVGQEYGSTTGRARKTNLLSLHDLHRAIVMNGVTDLVVNKMDVLRELNVWKMRHSLNGDEYTLEFDNEETFKYYLLNTLPNKSVQCALRDGNHRINVSFSDNPFDI